MAAGKPRWPLTLTSPSPRSLATVRSRAIVAFIIVYCCLVVVKGQWRHVVWARYYVCASSYVQRILINVFASLLQLVLTLDVMDVAGEHQSDISHSVYKVQLSPDGSEIKRERAPSKSLRLVPLD